MSDETFTRPSVHILQDLGELVYDHEDEYPEGALRALEAGSRALIALREQETDALEERRANEDPCNVHACRDYEDAHGVPDPNCQRCFGSGTK